MRTYFPNKQNKPGVVVHTFNLSIRRQRTICEFKVNQSYIYKTRELQTKTYFRKMKAVGL